MTTQTETYKAGTKLINASLARYRDGYVHCMTIVPKHCVLRADAYWHSHPPGCSMQLGPGTPLSEKVLAQALGALKQAGSGGSACVDLSERLLSKSRGPKSHEALWHADPYWHSRTLDCNAQHVGRSREALQIGSAPDGLRGISLSTSRENVMRPVACRCILALSC